MTFEEWTALWKPNPDFPECLCCGSTNTKEHHFVQMWCRGRKKWESESFCLDCNMFSWRSYADPDFKTPEETEKDRWNELIRADQNHSHHAVAGEGVRG